LLPLAVFVPDRPPAALLGAARVDRDAAPQLDDLAAAPGGRAAVPAREDRAPARAGGLLRPPRGPRGLPRCRLWGFCGDLEDHGGACVIFTSSLPEFPQAGGLTQ